MRNSISLPRREVSEEEKYVRRRRRKRTEKRKIYNTYSEKLVKQGFDRGFVLVTKNECDYSDEGIIAMTFAA